MAAPDSAISNLTTCPICLEQLKNPRSLPCNHALCFICAEEFFKHKKPKEKASCPICRKRFRTPCDGAGGLQVHFYAQEMVEQEKKRIRLQESSCDTHPDRQVELYCLDCKKNVCLTCSADNHRNHNSSEIGEVVQSYRSIIGDHHKQIQSAIGGARKQWEEAQQDATEFQRNVNDERKKVTAASDFVMHKVDRERIDVLKKLKYVASNSSKRFQRVQERYQQAIASMESFCRDSQELLDKGRPSDITRAGCELHDRATELLNNDVTAVKYRPPHVTFTPADVKQMKHLNLIGELTVTAKEQPDNAQDSQQLKQATDTVAVLQDELIQAADRELQLRVQFVKMTDDASQLQKWLGQRPSLQREFEDFSRRTAPKMEQDMKQRDMGHVIQTLPEGELVLGVTSLDNLLYVLRCKFSEQIEVYDIDTYRLLRCLTVPELGDIGDIVACKHNRCAYISDWSHEVVHRVAPPGATVTQWPVNDQPAGLSLTDRHGVLVTCPAVRKIKEFSTDGQLLHVLTLPQDVVSPWHSIQLSSGQFIVCHGGPNDPLHRVCLVGSDGSVVKSFGGEPSSGSQQMNVPTHMAVDRNEFVYVVDFINYRVLLLSPLLTYVRDVVTHEQLRWAPLRVHLDSDRGRLYVADNELKDGKWTAGRIVVSM